MKTNQESTSATDDRLVDLLEQHDGKHLIGLLNELQPCLKQHQKRVANMASLVAREMSLSEAQEEAIYIAASLHDIGMQQFNLPAYISKYNHMKLQEEFRRHPETGSELVKALSLDVPVDQIILQHHERLDGSGFPNKLKDVMIEAQIVAAIDIFDGVYSIHTKNPESALVHACDQIDEMRHCLLDPDVIDITIALAKENKLQHDL